MDREAVEKELAGLTTVIVHWDDAWTCSDEQAGDSPAAHCTVGFLGRVTKKSVELYMNTNTDPGWEKSHDVPFVIPTGCVRAVTRLVLDHTDEWQVSVRKVRGINHRKGAKK